MKITVYNPHQIGGCFTVIETDRIRIMIDYGEALSGTDTRQEDFDWKAHKVDAVFFTHYHGDHVGRIGEIPKEIPLYMGPAAREIMLNIHKSLKGDEARREEQEKLIRLLESDRVKEIGENERIKIGENFFVTPFSVDHSAYDAYMYLIEAMGRLPYIRGILGGMAIVVLQCWKRSTTIFMKTDER